MRSLSACRCGSAAHINATLSHSPLHISARPGASLCAGVCPTCRLQQGVAESGAYAAYFARLLARLWQRASKAWVSHACILWLGQQAFRNPARAGEDDHLARANESRISEQSVWRSLRRSFSKLFSANHLPQILHRSLHLGCHEMNRHKCIRRRFAIGYIHYRTRCLPATVLTQFTRTAVRSSLLRCHSQPVQLPLPRAPSHTTATLIYHLFWPLFFQRAGDLQSAEQSDGTSVHLPLIGDLVS